MPSRLQQIVQNNRLLDGWSIIHLASGVALGYILKSRVFAYAIIIFAEVFENTGLFREPLAQFFQEREGIANIISDLIIGFGGVEIG